MDSEAWESKNCESCRWHEPYLGICLNDRSEHRADFWDDGCEQWEGASKHETNDNG